MEFDRNLVLASEGNRYLVALNGTYFQIGKMLYDGILLRQQNVSWQNVTAHINKEYDTTYHPVELEKIFNEKLAVINENAAKKKKSYIHFRINFLSESIIEKFTKKFSWLFQKKLFFPIAVIGLCATLLYFLLGMDYKEITRSSEMKLAELGKAIILLYMVSISIMIFHELGHATASRHFGIRSSSIGFGLYIVFPVFFTNVSKVWTLPAKDRIIVNLGGIYFQLITNIILILSSLFMSANIPLLKLAINILIISNTFIIIGSLNPFLRNDGYWIFCDYFNISNLMEKVMIGPIDFLKKFYAPQNFKRKNLPLIIYGTINYMVFISLGYFIMRNINTSFSKVFEILSSDMFIHDLTASKLFHLLKIVMSLTLCSIYVIKICRLFFNKLFPSRKKAPLNPSLNEI